MSTKLEDLKLEAEIRKLEAEAAVAEAELVLRNLKADREGTSAPEGDNMMFYDEVGDVTVFNTIAALKQWSVRFPGRPLTLVINSGGGSITDGLHLYDYLQIFKQGHHLTTVGMGMAASMAGVLLQAGHERAMSPNAFLLIHEGSMLTGGSQSALEDSVKFLEALTSKTLAILAERSTLSLTQIKTRYKRRDWWMTSDEALKCGFIDRIG